MDPLLVTRDGVVATVALIKGACIVGGLEIAAMYDLRICGKSSRFGVLFAVLMLVTYVPVTGLGLVQLFYR